MGQSGGRMGDTLKTLLGMMEHGGQLRANMAAAYWPTVVGPIVARSAKPLHVKDGILIVRTRGSVWSQEISFLKHRIITDLNRLCGATVIRDIQFRVGEPFESADDPILLAPTPQQLQQADLNAEERTTLDACVDAASAITDPAIRAATVRLLDHSYRLRRWRLQNGWRLCSQCGRLYHSAEELCYSCSAER